MTDRVDFTGGTGRPPDPIALSRLHAMMAHLHLALARAAPRVVLTHSSEFVQSRVWTRILKLTPSVEYDKIDPSLKTKEYHYTEATVNLNKADEAHRASGGGDEEGTALALGKSELHNLE